MDAQSVDMAIHACCVTHGAREEVAQLQELLELALTERLTMLTRDPDAINTCVNMTFDRFSSVVASDRNINWRGWLTATALAMVAELTHNTAHLDEFVPRAMRGTALEKRALVVGTILTLGHDCQARLLKGSAGLLGRLVDSKCRRLLNQRLATLMR